MAILTLASWGADAGRSGLAEAKPQGAVCGPGSANTGGAAAPAAARPEIEQAVDRINTYLRSVGTHELLPGEQLILQAILDVLLQAGSEAFQDRLLTKSDIPRLQAFIQAVEALKGFFLGRGISDKDAAAAIHMLTGLVVHLLRDLVAGLQDVPPSLDYYRAVESITIGDSGNELRLCVDVNEEVPSEPPQHRTNLNRLQFHILSLFSDIPSILHLLFKIDLIFYADTEVRIAFRNQFDIQFTPGTVFLDFTDFCKIIGFPDDIWVTEVTLFNGDLIIYGSLNRNGTELRRYVFRGTTVIVERGLRVGQAILYGDAKTKDLTCGRR